MLKRFLLRKVETNLSVDFKFLLPTDFPFFLKSKIKIHEGKSMENDYPGPIPLGLPCLVRKQKVQISLPQNKILLSNIKSQETVLFAQFKIAFSSTLS